MYIEQQIDGLTVVEIAFYAYAIVEQPEFKAEVDLTGFFPPQVFIGYRFGVHRILERPTAGIITRIQEPDRRIVTDAVISRYSKTGPDFQVTYEIHVLHKLLL